MWRKVLRLIRAASAAYDVDGPRGAIRTTAVWVQDLVCRPIDRHRDRSRDVELGTDTATSREETTTARATVDNDADWVSYERVSSRRLTSLFRWLPVNPSWTTFIDLGCGKGAALLMALDFGFANVVGVEHDPSLATAARKNIARLPASQNSTKATGEVVECDAAQYEIGGSGPCVVFMYNPFGTRTLAAVLERLIVANRHAPRELWIAYLNPVYQAHLMEISQLYRIDNAPANYAIFRVQ